MSFCGWLVLGRFALHWRLQRGLLGEQDLTWNVPTYYSPQQRSPASRAATRAGKRDRAILMILIAYGLRAGELRALRLDDVDWENETLHVRRLKSGQTQTFPLSPSVGRAVLRYILEVRPRFADRTLFVKLLAPIRPLSSGAVGTIVRSRLDRLGIVADSRGPHALRHAAAQHLLDEGMSMKVIGDYLGHRDPTSTRTYAKFDLHSLREVADLDLEVAT